MMKRLSCIFAAWCLVLLSGFSVTAQVSTNNTILQNLMLMPDYTIIARSLSTYPSMSAIRDILNSTDSNCTFMAPNNAAVRNEVRNLDALLQKSGYPPLRTLFPNSPGTQLGDETDDEFFSAVLAGAIPLEDEPQREVEFDAGTDYTKIPPNLNITDALIKYYQTCMKYHIVEGNWSSVNFTAGHEFLTTLADNKTWVGLGGDKQRMHVENLTSSVSASMTATGAELSTVPSVVILFGGASDPLPPDVRQRLQSTQFYDGGSSGTGNTTGIENFISRMILTDVASSNGMIQGIDKVVELPMNASIVMYEANLITFLHAAETSGALGDIQDHDNITLFIPQNLNLQNNNQTEIRNLIRNHVMRGAWYPTMLRDNTTIDNLFNDTSVSCHMQGANNVTVGGSKIIRAGYLLRNGCAYLIDRPFAQNATMSGQNKKEENSAAFRASIGVWTVFVAASVAALMWM